MGTGSAKKKTPSKSRVSTAERHSATEGSNLDASPMSVKPPSTPKTTTYSHHLPSGRQRQANGRHAGRSLIMWNRPRMTEKLLLHTQYECARHNIQLPWDAIAHRLHPGSSGAAIVQHLARVRRDLITTGHLVPPLAGKTGVAGSVVDPEVRGYVRQDMDGDDKQTTRVVTFAEKMDDPKLDLPGFLPDDEHGISDDAYLDQPNPDSMFLESPTPQQRAYSKLGRSPYDKITPGHPLYTDPEMTDMKGHITPVDDDVFVSPRARRDDVSFTSSFDTTQSNISDIYTQEKFTYTQEFGAYKSFYGGVVPWFASPFDLGTPTGYIPIHFGSPISLPDQQRCTHEPEYAPSAYNVSGIGDPGLVPKRDLSNELVESIGSMEADESNIDDLINDDFDGDSLSE